MKRGFTITELLLSIAIFIIVIVSITAIYISGQNLYGEAQTRAELLQNGRVLSERLTRELRQAREVVTSIPSLYENATSTVLFEDGHIDNNYHYIRYFKDGSLVKREVVGYYFSDDGSETLVSWDSIPPEGQSLEEKNLENAQIVSEFINSFSIWSAEPIMIEIILENNGRTIPIRTSCSVRNR